MSQNSQERGKKNRLKSLQNYCDVKWRFCFLTLGRYGSSGLSESRFTPKQFLNEITPI
jgi:hypothetical protein